MLTPSSAYDAAVTQESNKTEPDLSYLPNLRPAISIMHLMITCIHTVLIPLASSNTTVRREMEKTTNLAINRMEEKTNNVIQRTIDVILNWVSKLLAGQKKSDFRPKDVAVEGGGVWLEMLQTPVSRYPLLAIPLKKRISLGPNSVKLIDLPLRLRFPN
jgi:hypothetical protein